MWKLLNLESSFPSNTYLKISEASCCKHWDSQTCLLSPRELYPGFREVFSYLLMSSAEGASTKDLWCLHKRNHCQGENTMNYIKLINAYFKINIFWEWSQRTQISLVLSNSNALALKSCQKYCLVGAPSSMMDEFTQTPQNSKLYDSRTCFVSCNHYDCIELPPHFHPCITSSNKPIMTFSKVH